MVKTTIYKGHVTNTFTFAALICNLSALATLARVQWMLKALTLQVLYDLTDC